MVSVCHFSLVYSLPTVKQVMSFHFLNRQIDDKFPHKFTVLLSLQNCRGAILCDIIEYGILNTIYIHVDVGVVLIDTTLSKTVVLLRNKRCLSNN